MAEACLEPNPGRLKETSEKLDKRVSWVDPTFMPFNSHWLSAQKNLHLSNG